MDYRKDRGNILLDIPVITLLKVGYVDGSHGVSDVDFVIVQSRPGQCIATRVQVMSGKASSILNGKIRTKTVPIFVLAVMKRASKLYFGTIEEGWKIVPVPSQLSKYPLSGIMRIVNDQPHQEQFLNSSKTCGIATNQRGEISNCKCGIGKSWYLLDVAPSGHVSSNRALCFPQKWVEKTVLKRVFLSSGETLSALMTSQSREVPMSSTLSPDHQLKFSLFKSVSN